jgi:hypothetical protein
VKGFNSELMARPGYSLGARLTTAAFRPQSADPHGYVNQGGLFDQAAQLPLDQMRPRDRWTAAARQAVPSSPLAIIVCIDLSARCRLACRFAI